MKLNSQVKLLVLGESSNGAEKKKKKPSSTATQSPNVNNAHVSHIYLTVKTERKRERAIYRRRGEGQQPSCKYYASAAEELYVARKNR